MGPPFLYSILESRLTQEHETRNLKDGLGQGVGEATFKFDTMHCVPTVSFKLLLALQQTISKESILHRTQNYRGQKN